VNLLAVPQLDAVITPDQVQASGATQSAGAIQNGPSQGKGFPPFSQPMPVATRRYSVASRFLLPTVVPIRLANSDGLQRHLQKKREKRMRNTFSVLGLVLIFGLAGRVSAQVADPTPSPVLAYEGRLAESNVLVTGSRPFTFSILDSTGNELWNSGAQNLTVVEGLYGIVLGATGMPALPASLTLKANLHLHVIANGVALIPDISLIPALQASSSWSVIGPFSGDISGNQQGISVDKLKGIPIDLTGVATGQVLTFDGTSWIASTAAGGQGPQGPAGPTGATGPAGTEPGSPPIAKPSKLSRLSSYFFGFEFEMKSSAMRQRNEARPQT